MDRLYHETYENPIFCKLNWNTKINTRRNEDLFMNKFRSTFGSPEDTVVVFGDWEQKQGCLRGLEPTKGKSLRKMIREKGYQVYLLDEYRTSKTCSWCHEETESRFISRPNPRPWKRNESEKVWGLLRCKNGNCRRVHNRDFNSASNQLFIVQELINGHERPFPFRREWYSKTCIEVPHE